MCIAYPMRINAINGTMANVSAGGIKSIASIQLISSAKVGDYVLVHAGIAIEKVDRVKAKEILKSLAEIERKINDK